MNILVIIAVGFAAIAVKCEQIVKVTQDTLGNYDLTYSVLGSSRTENRDQDGLVKGEYAYVDPNGVLRKTVYSSGPQGFQALSSDIPVPVADTPEVALAKNEHLVLLRTAETAKPAEGLEVAPSITSDFLQLPLGKIAEPSAPPLVLELPRGN